MTLARKYSLICSWALSSYPDCGFRIGSTEVIRGDPQCLRYRFVPPTRGDPRSGEQGPWLRWNVSRLLECGCPPVHHALVSIASYPHTVCSAFASGHHPFDYGELADDNSDCDSESLELKSWEEKLSMSYIRNDRRVRKRIIDDDLEFSSEPWDSLEAGTLSYHQ